jgi:hypothetical protein
MSHGRFSGFSSPLPNIGANCLDWAPCGLAAVAAERSVLIYRATKSELYYLMTVDLGRSNPVWISFHSNDPLLAIADDKHELLIFSCESTHLSTEAKLGGRINVIRWKNNVLLILKKSRVLQAWDFSKHQSVWKVDLDSEFSTFSVDPFTPFRIILSSASGGFIIVTSSSADQCPRGRGDSNSVSGASVIDCFFHPQVAGLVVLVMSGRLSFYEINTRSLTFLRLEESPVVSISAALFSQFDNSEMFVQFSDASLCLYRDLQEKCTMKFKRELPGRCSACISPVHRHRYLTYSILNGLALVKASKSHGFVIKIAPFVPVHVTCFDCFNDWIAAGTETGELWMVHCETADIKLRRSLSQSAIVQLKFQTAKLAHFVSERESGSYNFETRELRKFRAAVDLKTSDNLAILVHSNQAIGIVLDGRERPFILTQPMIDVVAQTGTTPATLFAGNNPNFAILSQSGCISVYSSRSSKSVLSFKGPAELVRPSAIAWSGNSFALGDESGAVVLHDFEYGTDRQFNAMPDIARIEFCGNDLLVLSRTGTLGLLKGRTCVHRWNGVRGFVVSRSGRIFAMSEIGQVKTLVSPAAAAIERVNLIGSRDQRLNLLTARILNSDDKSPLFISGVYEESGFLFESILWRTIDRFFDGKPLSLKWALFGKRDEIVASLKYRQRFILASQSIEAVIGLQARLHDLRGISRTFLTMSPENQNFVSYAIAGSLLTGDPVSDGPRETLQIAAVSLLALRKYTQGTILLQLCGLDLTAVRYLQDGGHWEESLEIVRTMGVNADTRQLVRRAAHVLLDRGDKSAAMLLFASLGDFHPVLAVLGMDGNACAAFHLMMFLDSRGTIAEYDEDTTKFHIQFCEMEILRQQIVQKAEKYMALSST